MPCYTPPPEKNENEMLTIMLCAACKHLTRENMAAIEVPGYVSLFEWYLQHKADDLYKNYFSSKEDADFAISEFKRLGVPLKFAVDNDNKKLGNIEYRT